MDASDDNDDEERPTQEMERDADGSESDDEEEVVDEDEEAPVHMIDALLAFERSQSLTLTELLRPKTGGGGPGRSGGGSVVPSLVVQSLAALVGAGNSDVSHEREPEAVVVRTCRYLVAVMQSLYKVEQQQEEEEEEDGGLAVDPAAKKALQEALSVRIPSLPDDKRYDLDGCDVVLDPPDTSDTVLPATVAGKVLQFFRDLKGMGRATRRMAGVQRSDGTLLSLEELRGHPKYTNEFAMFMMYAGYSVGDCCDAFGGHPDPSECDVYEFLDDFANKTAYGDGEDEYDGKRRDVVLVCAFAGIVLALRDYKDYMEAKKKRGNDGEAKEEEDSADDENRDDDGHIIYQEDEAEIYHGWSGSWPVDENKPKKNDFYYGVKLGTILVYAEEQAKRMLKKPASGPQHSSPFARFHADVSDEPTSPKAADEPSNAHDLKICRAAHFRIEDNAFYGDDSSAYSAIDWSHDGLVGFAHTGGGWKNREFKGYMYSFDACQFDHERGYSSRELNHEFWSTPSHILADSGNDMAWVHGDQRIKGYAIRRDALSVFYTKYVFNIVDNPKMSSSLSAGETKRRKLLQSREAEHGRANLMVFGKDRVGYLDKGYLQEWKLDEANKHDGVSRMVGATTASEDIARAQWRKEDILDLSDGCWMDEDGQAEVTRGVKPDSIRPVDIVTPTSIGYLSNDRLAFANACFQGAHHNNGQIPIYDHSLREVARLVGLANDGIEIVQRPTFGGAGDDSTFVASDSSCVKIYDLRSGKAEMTIRQRCVDATPVYVGDAKYVCSRLRGGKGAMMWDLRAPMPVYSLPVSGNINVAWVPGTDDPSKPPLLMCSNGEIYKFDGSNDNIDEEDRRWEKRDADSAWAKLEKAKDDEGCSIM